MRNLLILIILSNFLHLQGQSIFDKEGVIDIKVSLPDKKYMRTLDSLALGGNQSTIAEVSIDGQALVNAQVRYGKLGYATGAKRNPWVISSDEPIGGSKSKSIELAAMLRDPSCIREVAARLITAGYITTPRATFARLYVNNEFNGVYTLVEGIDADFIQGITGMNTGEAYDCGMRMTVAKQKKDICLKSSGASLLPESNSDCFDRNYNVIYPNTDKSGLNQLIDVLNNKPDQIESILDVDKTLWYLAINNVLGHLNSYTGDAANYHLFKNKNNKFEIIPGTYQFAFGTSKNTGVGGDLKPEEMSALNVLLHQDNINRPLISQLLKNESYKKIYLSHVKQIIADQFGSGKFDKLCRKLQARIKGDIVKDVNKYYKTEEFDKSLMQTIGGKSKVPGLVQFMNERVIALRKMADVAILSPKIKNCDVKKRPEYSQDKITKFEFSVLSEKSAKQVWLYYNYSGDGNYKKVQMLDDGQNGDEGEKDGVFGIAVEPDATGNIYYYITSENTKAITFYPAQYSVKPGKANLEELNK